MSKIRIFAIVALSFLGASLLSLILFLIFHFGVKASYSNVFSIIALCCFAVGLVIYFWMYAVKAFPMQRQKEEERLKIQMDYQDALDNENQEQQEEAQEEKVNGES